MYKYIQLISYVLFLVVFTLQGKNFNVSRVKAIILGLCSMVINWILLKSLAWIENGFDAFGAENIIRVYVFLPVLFYLLAKVANVKPTKFLDMHAIVGPLVYGVGHLACIFAGCCHGFKYYEGTVMYNIAHTLTGGNMLPLQLFESVSALVVFELVYIVGRIKNYKTNGRLFCLWYIVFGTQRFFWEFLRDNTKVIIFAPMKQADGYIGISNLAIWSALMAIAGVVMLVFIRNLEKKNKI